MSVNKSSCMEKWGSLLTGIGTILVGVAAIIALCQTKDLLNEVLKIQDQADEIKTAVILLSEQIKSNKAEKTVESSSALKKDNPSEAEIEEALETLPYEPIGDEPMLILPKDVRKSVILEMKTAPKNERPQILQKYLKIGGRKTNE